jgi:hypothetical protein
MRRETRANLIFISVFLILVIPGAVLLFKKKLDPSTPPMFMPDFVRRRLPYMASQQSPAQVARYVPELTGRWVSEMTHTHAGGLPVLTVDRLPLISDDHVVQLTAMQPRDPSGTTLHLIVWDTARDASNCAATLASGTDRHAVEVISSTCIPMPADVKRELMNGGVIQPPSSIIWLTLRAPLTLPGSAPHVLELSFPPDQMLSTIHIPATGGFSTN